MKLYFKYFTMQLRCQMQYKISFILTVIGQFISSFTAFLGVYFMFKRFYKVDDFTFPEILLCFAVVLFSFSLAECFIRGFDTFSAIISNGEFDRILLRPRGLIFQVIASKIELTRIGRMLQAVFIFCYAIPNSGVFWSFDKIIIVLLMIIGGFITYTALFMIYASFCFFTTEGLEFMNVLTDGTREFGRYPLSIYGDGILRFFTYAVPIALFQYYPLLYLLGRTNNLLYAYCPLFCFLFLIPSLIFWRIGLRHYKSTGS